MAKTDIQIIVVLATLIVLISGCQYEPSSHPHPNVILIITDDQGYGDLGFHGNPYIQTPNLDRFAANSIRLTNFYVCPVCAPTRASLMTGRYHIRTGVWDTYNGGAIMATEEVTIAEVFRDNGYHTGIFGKWHLGDNYPFRPKDQGFNESLVHRGGGIGQVGDVINYFHFDSSYFDPVLLENGTETEKKGYCSDIFAEEAIRFVEEHHDSPFFLYLSFNAPHTPLQLPGKYEQMYANLQMDSSAFHIKGFPVPEMNENNIQSAKRVYGMVSNIDDNLGRLFQTLERHQLRDNTIVIFMTDNGPQQVRYTAGLRGRKGSVYEGGIKVPSFWSVPGDFEANRSIEVPAAHIDVLPTLVELCHLQPTGELPFDGKSLVPLLRNKEVPWKDRALFFHWQRGYPEPYRNTAVRKGVYKLVGQTGQFAEIGDFELFNIKEDPWEINNIIKQDPETARVLKEEFDRYYAEIIHSPNLKPQRIRIGTGQENPVILNRNDAKGSPGIWAQEQIYGYWDIAVLQEGSYDITFHFHHDLDTPGNMILKTGTLQRTEPVQGSTERVSMKDVYLEPGDYMFESWFSCSTGNYMPFYVTILKNS